MGHAAKPAACPTSPLPLQCNVPRILYGLTLFVLHLTVFLYACAGFFLHLHRVTLLPSELTVLRSRLVSILAVAASERNPEQ